jgi:glutathionylspermidine synthase
MSSWVIHGMPAGICFREDLDKLTNNNSEFLLHYFMPSKEVPRVFNF